MLEVNPNPDLSSDAGLARMGRAFGWDYDDLVLHIVDEALMRSAEPSRRRRPASAGCPPRERHRSRRRASATSSAADRGRVEAMTRAVGLFRADEIPVALEVFDDAGAPAAQNRLRALGRRGRRHAGRLDLLGARLPAPWAPSISTGSWWIPRSTARGHRHRAGARDGAPARGPCPADRGGDRRSSGLCRHSRGSTRRGATVRPRRSRTSMPRATIRWCT